MPPSGREPKEQHKSLWRHGHEARLAARRYEGFDPDQRLVAAELEVLCNAATLVPNKAVFEFGARPAGDLELTVHRQATETAAGVIEDIAADV